MQVFKEIGLVQRRKTSIQEGGNHMQKRHKWLKEYRPPCGRQQYADLARVKNADNRRMKTEISKMVEQDRDY